MTETSLETTEVAEAVVESESFVFERPLQTVGRRKEATTSMRCCTAVARPARPARCGWASPVL